MKKLLTALFSLALFLLVAPAARADLSCFCQYPLDTSVPDCSGQTYVIKTFPGEHTAAKESECRSACMAAGSAVKSGVGVFYRMTSNPSEYCSFRPGSCKQQLMPPDKISPNCNYCFCQYPADFVPASCAGKSVHIHMVSNGGFVDVGSVCNKFCGAAKWRSLGTYTSYDAQCDFSVKSGQCAPINKGPSCDTATSGGPSGVTAPLTGQSVITAPLPLGNLSVQGLIGRVIGRVLGVVGAIAFLMFVYGGIVWMTSAGNEKRIATAKATIVWAVLGLVMIFLAYAIVSAMLGVFSQPAETRGTVGTPDCQSDSDCPIKGHTCSGTGDCAPKPCLDNSACPSGSTCAGANASSGLPGQCQ